MRWLRCCFLVGALALVGCGAETVGYTEVSYAPYVPYDYGYPYTFYEGRTVYLVGNRWMYPDNGAWYYYRSPPAGLYRAPLYHYPAGRTYAPSYGPTYGPSRTRPYVQQAPPATRGPGVGAPPGRISAPPARRR